MPWLHIRFQGSVQYLDPTREQDFSGLYQLYQDIRTWNWVYGRTPKFSVHRTIQATVDKHSRPVSITVDINKGLINKIQLQSEGCDMVTHERNLNELMRGVRFWSTDISHSAHSYGAQSVINRDRALSDLITGIVTMSS